MVFVFNDDVLHDDHHVDDGHRVQNLDNTVVAGKAP